MLYIYWFCSVVHLTFVYARKHNAVFAIYVKILRMCGVRNSIMKILLYFNFIHCTSKSILHKNEEELEMAILQLNRANILLFRIIVFNIIPKNPKVIWQNNPNKFAWFKCYICIVYNSAKTTNNLQHISCIEYFNYDVHINKKK